MRNLKKVLSVLLVVCMLATAMVPAFAAESFTYEAQAKALYDLGLFKGTSATEFVPNLGGDLNREQGMAIIVRLLGKADAAAALTAADADAALAAFGDAKDVEPTLKNAVAYAIKNGLVKGDGKLVDPKGKMEGKMLATILLRNLGYADTEFTYDTAAADLAAKGGLTTAEATKFNNKELIRDDLVGMAYGALNAKYKAGQTVIAKLIADKVITEDAAIKAGVIKPVTGITATVTGAKKLTVNFGTAVDTTKVTFEVKKGSSAYTLDGTPAFAEDKKSAVLTLNSTLTKGEYTVKVSGIATDALTAKVVAEDEKVTKIEFGSDNAVLKEVTSFDKVTVGYKILNQYNEDVTKKYWSNVNFNSSKGDTTPSNGSIEIGTFITNPFFIGEKIAVTATYIDAPNAVSVFQSATLTVVQMAQVAEITIKELYNEDKKTLGVDSSYGDFKLIVEAKDQYGKAISAGDLASGLIITSTDKSVLELSTSFMKLADGRVALALAEPSPKKAGSATVMLVSKYSGKMAQFTVKVEDSTKIDTLSIQSPEYAIAKEEIILPFTAIDQNGKEITKMSGLVMSNDLTVTGDALASIKFRQNPVTGKPELVLDATRVTDKKTLYITGTTSTYKFVQHTINLQAPAVPDQLSGLKSDYKTNLLINNTGSLKHENLIVKDQYGRDMSDAKLATSLAGNYRVKIENNDPTKVSFAGSTVVSSVYTNIMDGSNLTLNLDTGVRGSTLVKATLQEKDASGNWKYKSDASFSLATVEKKDIASYTVNDIANLYCNPNYITAGAYKTEVKVEGVLSNGKKVDVPQALTDDLGNVIKNFEIRTDDNLTVSADTYNKNIEAAATHIGLATDKSKDASYIVKVYGANKEETIVKNTKILGEVPVANTISLQSKAGFTKESDAVLSVAYTAGFGKTNAENAAYTAAVKIVDQYGKTMTNSSIISSVTISDVRNDDGELVSTDTYGQGYTVYVTIITKNSKIFSFTLALK